MKTEFTRRLAQAPARTLRGIVVRAVAAVALFPAGLPASPDFLFTSGRENRYNPAGTICLYWSEDEATALAEYRRQFQGLQWGRSQPVTLFQAQIQLTRVLDLADTSTRQSVGVTQRHLDADWGGGLPPTVAQKIGAAVAQRGLFCAIRYRSIAASKMGETGCNLVIFKRCLNPPDFVRVLGPFHKPLQAWP